MTYEEIIERVLSMTEDERKQITQIVKAKVKQQCGVDLNNDQVVDYCLFYVSTDKFYSSGKKLDEVLGEPKLKYRRKLRNE